MPVTAAREHNDRSRLALLVDQDDDTREMYAVYLRRVYQIEEARDGREGLVKAIARHPDVIVTATHLAGIDGYALCDLLRHDQSTQKIPIIVVTSDAYASDYRPRARSRR